MQEPPEYEPRLSEAERYGKRPGTTAVVLVFTISALFILGAVAFFWWIAAH